MVKPSRYSGTVPPLAGITKEMGYHPAEAGRVNKMGFYQKCISHL